MSFVWGNFGSAGPVVQLPEVEAERGIQRPWLEADAGVCLLAEAGQAVGVVFSVGVGLGLGQRADPFQQGVPFFVPLLLPADQAEVPGGGGGERWSGP